MSLTASADLFAMGAILYEMLSGIAAFRGESIHDRTGESAPRRRADARGLAGGRGCGSRYSPRARQIGRRSICECGGDGRGSAHGAGLAERAGERPSSARHAPDGAAVPAPETRRRDRFPLLQSGRCGDELAFSARVARRSLDLAPLRDFASNCPDLETIAAKATWTSC